MYITLDRRGVGDCTSGFMSQNRMDAVLKNVETMNYIPSQIASANTTNVQGIFPGMNFTCSGTVQSWMFGAEWHDIDDNSTNGSFPQLQIWRPIGNGSYTRVGNTTIMAANLITTRYYSAAQLYQYHPSSPLAFQAGDILGYYQPRVPTSKLELYLQNRQGQLGHFNSVTNEPTQFVVRNSDMVLNTQLVIAVVTG